MNEKMKAQLKPIYEGVGTIVQSSQQMEYSIVVSLVLLAQLDDSTYYSDQVFDENLDKFTKHTLGRLINSMKGRMDIDQHGVEALKLCLKERNYIVHEFFRSNGKDFLSESGRERLNKRIQDARINIHPGFLIIDKIATTLFELSGLTEADIMEEVKSKIT